MEKKKIKKNLQCKSQVLILNYCTEWNRISEINSIAVIHCTSESINLLDCSREREKRFFGNGLLNCRTERSEAKRFCQCLNENCEIWKKNDGKKMKILWKETIECVRVENFHLHLKYYSFSSNRLRERNSEFIFVCRRMDSVNCYPSFFCTTSTSIAFILPSLVLVCFIINT